MIQSYADRRDYRVQANLLARLTGDGLRPEFGLISDISLGGMKLLLHQPVAPEATLTIEFQLNSQSVSFPGVCRWSRPVGVARYEYYTGVSFARLEPEQYQELRALIYQLAGR